MKSAHASTSNHVRLIPVGVTFCLASLLLPDTLPFTQATDQSSRSAISQSILEHTFPPVLPGYLEVQSKQFAQPFLTEPVEVKTPMEWVQKGLMNQPVPASSNQSTNR